MRIAIDTNRYTDLAHNDPAAVDLMSNADHVYLPVMALAELRVGFVMGNRPAQNEGVLRRFLQKPNVSVLNTDEQTAFHYAQIMKQLRQQGTPIPTNDVWIASLVVQHGLTLYTRDAHFTNLAQIPTI